MTDIRSRVVILEEAQLKLIGGDLLCLQEVSYQNGDGTNEPGFRFIRRDGETLHMKAQRGQANLQTLGNAHMLLDELSRKKRDKKKVVRRSPRQG